MQDNSFDAKIQVEISAESPAPVAPSGLRRWLSFGALAAVIVGLFVYAAVGGRPASPIAKDSTTASAVPTVSTIPWPSAATVCGSSVQLPLVTSAAELKEPTSIQIAVGGSLSTVDLDTGQSTLQTGLVLQKGQLVSEVVSVGEDLYALISNCRSDRGAVARIGPDGSLISVSTTKVSTLIGGGTHIWGFTPSDSGAGGTLDPLDGSPAVQLPQDFYPLGAYQDQVVGVRDVPDLPGPAADLFIFDTATSALSTTIGHTGTSQIGARFAIASSAVVLWTDKPCESTDLCQIHRYDLATGSSSVRGYALPKGRYFGASTVSPDGTKLVGQLNRDDINHKFSPSAGLPSDIAVLDLVSGAMQVVPGIELSAQSNAALTYSNDSKWLVIGLNTGAKIALYVWKPGLEHPLASPSDLDAGTPYSPVLTTLPAS